jgi:hypothetical protein
MGERHVEMIDPERARASTVWRWTSAGGEPLHPDSPTPSRREALVGVGTG